jgi:cysteine desulfurase
VLFFSDAVQAVGAIPVDVVKNSVDMLSLSAHKFHGPKGIGALYVREGIEIAPMLHGGKQESGRRAGTENVAGIVGLACAIQRKQDADKTRRLRDILLNRLLGIPGAALNGDMENRLPGNINISFEGIWSESLVLMLAMRGIAVSTASACTSGERKPSHVLTAMGISPERAGSAVRITLGDFNTECDVEYIAEVMPEVVGELGR